MSDVTPLAVPEDPAAPLTPGGTWTDVDGARAGVAAGGIKYADRDDVVVLHASGTVAAVTTRSAAAAAPCRWVAERVPGPCEAIVINSGNANAATGPKGADDARSMAEAVADVLGCGADDVLVASTGVIGVPMPMDRVLPAVREAAGDRTASGDRAARAIMTTDLVPKQAASRAGDVVVGGIAKGSGMIHPDMATMLAFVATNATVEPEALQALCRDVADRTFNSVTVDGDTSTNDTFTLHATGTGPLVRPRTSAWADLEAATYAVCRHLAREMARDGEGAEHLIEVIVQGLPDAQARAAARVVARSPLVKTAVHGRDANWGRVVGALGTVGIAPDALDLDLAGIPVLRNGRPVPFDEEAATAAMGAAEVRIVARLGDEGIGRAWGCDLTDGYVRINADYRS